MINHSGNVQNSIMMEEHDGSINAKRVSIVSTATLYAVVNTGASNSNITLNPSNAYIGLTTAVIASLPNEGQQTMDNSISVAIASNQSDLPVVNTDTLGENTVYTTGDPTRLAGYIAKTTPTQLVTGDGRYSVPQTTLKGEVYVKHTDLINSITTIAPRTDYIGLVSVSGTVGVSGLISLASGTEVRTRPVSNITLNASDAYIGLATVVNANQPALVASSAYIGLASVNVGNVVNSIVTLAPRTDYIGLVSVSGTVGVSGLISLASGTEVRVRPVSNVTLNASDAYIGLATVVNANQPALVASSAYIGLASVNVGNVINGIVTLAPRTDFIGLMTVTQGNQPALVASTAYIGLASVNVGNVVNSIVTIAPRTDYIGLVSVSGTVGISGLISLASGTEVRTRPISNVTLNASDAYIGLATVIIASVPTIHTYALPFSFYQTVSCASGYKFYGLAAPGSNPTTSVFRLQRENLTSGEILFGSGSGTFIHQWSSASLGSIAYL